MYLATALTIIEQHALHRQRLDWSTIRAAATQHAAHAQHAADTYDTIRWVLTQLGEAHSFFAIPEGNTAIASGSYNREVTKPTAQLHPDRIGYLHVAPLPELAVDRFPSRHLPPLAPSPAPSPRRRYCLAQAATTGAKASSWSSPTM